MTNTEKILLVLCMIMVMMFSLFDILTLYNAVCWELGAELFVFVVSNIMCYMTITEKYKKVLDKITKSIYNKIIK